MATEVKNYIQTKENISKLVEKYEKLKAGGRLNSYNEAQTRNEFIEPLFEFLGWDMRNNRFENEVTTEEKVSRGRVDLAFRIFGIPKMFLEAKSLKTDLDIDIYARQAINYAWNKGVIWAILTDFESIKVFNSLTASKHLYDKIVFEIPYSEFISDFDRLWLLSKEAFTTNELDKYAEKYGKKIKKVTVNEKLFIDLKECREILTKDLEVWNENLDKETLDEGVQRILDRLIFIRVLEDKGLEPPTLLAILREWENSDRKNTLFQMLVKKFRELDDLYNSNLFTKHACEDWEDHEESIKKVIKKLYSKETYEYDFKEIPADILGGVYESYLGYIERSKESKAQSKTKRKSQGIYYTPKYIVDYIVKNTLGEKLKEVKNLNDLKKIKVLDPACGSGPFLTMSLEMINDKYKEFGNRGNQYTKSEILLSNIYGVDLDPQAVELARLNLLIDALDEKAKLPNLTRNVKMGNSLISEGDPNLHPFNWEEEFKEVFDQGGFDVIVGNPPYIKEYTNKTVFDNLHDSPYYQGKMDIWTLFACRAIDLLKKGGYFSFIAPNNWLTNAGASIFREKILAEGEIKKFIDFGDFKVFREAGIQTMIFVFKKGDPSKSYRVSYAKIVDRNVNEETVNALLQSDLENVSDGIVKLNAALEPQTIIKKNITFNDNLSEALLRKIESRKNFELTFKEVGNGIHPHYDFVNKSIALKHNNKFRAGEGIFGLNDEEKENLHLTKLENELIKPYFTTKELGRYYANPKNKLWIIYTNSKFKNPEEIEPYPNIKAHLDKFKDVITSDNKPYGLHRTRDEKFFKGKKIVVQRKCLEKPVFAYTDFDCYVSATFNVIKTDRLNQKYLTGLLNSNLMRYWLNHKGKMQGSNFQIDKEPLLNLPIINSDKTTQNKIAGYVNQIMGFNADLHKATPDTDRSERIEQEIQKLDKKIDQEVFKLYSLTEKEIKTIESSS